MCAESYSIKLIFGERWLSSLEKKFARIRLGLCDWRTNILEICPHEYSYS